MDENTKQILHEYIDKNFGADFKIRVRRSRACN